jgi:hypothetical protein
MPLLRPVDQPLARSRRSTCRRSWTLPPPSLPLIRGRLASIRAPPSPIQWPPTPSSTRRPKMWAQEARTRPISWVRAQTSSRTKLSATLGDPVADPTAYRSLAGALQYLTFTRPDLTYVVQQICLHMHDPRESHLAALKRLLRYHC